MSAVSDAVEAVRDGDHVIYPTETCYGLGCDATDPDAIEQVYDLKQRPRSKGLTAIVADMQMAERYCVLDADERALVEAFMPGPLTLIAEKTAAVPDELNTAFAFRIPGSETARALTGKAGVPVVATSANISGQGPHYRVQDIEQELVDAVDAIIDAGALEQQAPSTIVEIDDEVVIHREGPVTRNAIMEVLA